MATITYERISSYTLPSAVNTYQINSIPSTYTDIVVVVSILQAVATNTSAFYNLGDAANGMDYNAVYGLTGFYNNSTVALAEAAGNLSEAYLNGNGTGTSTTLPLVYQIHIFNYANTTTFKTTMSHGGNSNRTTYFAINRWARKRAVDRIEFTIGTGVYKMAAGSTFSVYGIKAV